MDAAWLTDFDFGGPRAARCYASVRKLVEHAVNAYRELQKSPAVQAIKSLWVDLRDETATPATKELKAAVDAHPDWRLLAALSKFIDVRGGIERTYNPSETER
jgi:hypothetical protein